MIEMLQTNWKLIAVLKLCLLLQKKPQFQKSSLFSWEDLPVDDQYLPDLLHEDVVVAEQDGELGVGVVEAVQQHLRHLPLLLHHQPVAISLKFDAKSKNMSLVFSSPPLFSVSPLPIFQEARACH